jgi:hypothetical protein
MIKMKHKFVSGNDRKLFLICCLLFFFFFWAPSLPAERGANLGENEILAIGTGAVVGGNLAMAKEIAISQALMKGIEDYLVYRMGRLTVVNNFQRFTHEVIPGAKEGIENFHILAESQIGDKYSILVRLKINEKIIDEKLERAGLILTEGPPIKALFLISETRKGATLFWWEDPEIHSAMSPIELALHNAFQNKGLTTINRTLNVPEDEYTKDLRSPDLEDDAVLRWGMLFSADVVICGQARIVDDKEISLALRALDVDQGVQICQGMHSESIIKGPKGKEQMTETLERLVNRLVTRLAPVIIQAGAPDNEKVHHLDITLTGLKTYNQFREFRDFLRNSVTGVKSVRQTRVRKGSISIAVEFRGDRDRFIDRVLKHKNLPFSLDFDQTEEGEILLNIVEQSL